MNNFVFLNDKFLNFLEAKLELNDLGVLRGFGVFDFSSVHSNNIFMLEDHLKRLQNSAKILRLKLPFALSRIADISKELIAKNNLGDSSVRWILTGGPMAGKFARRETFYILNEKATVFPEKYYTKGVNVMTVDFKREITEAKTLNYQYLYSHHEEMKKNNAFELIYAPNGIVLEGGSSNIFFIKEGKLITPENDVLYGITRKYVMELARKNNIPLEVRPIAKKEMIGADEVFITATLKKVMPVTKINGKKVGDGNPGIITNKVMKLYDSLIHSD